MGEKQGSGSIQETEIERFRTEVKDARELLEFAVAEGRPVEDGILSAIKTAESSLLEPDLPSPEERAAFERAYRDLAKALAPITVQTLRATADRSGRKFWLARWHISEGKIWSRKLWLLTSIFVAFALFGENLDRILTQFFPVDEETEANILTWQIVSSILQSLVPFTYGAIGSCAYLLRSCHTHVYRREFDPNRIPEYYNRILLGIVSGGAILLFIEQVTTGEGAIRISATALAFLAGYNTDLLFTTVERIAAALLPKVGLETMRRAPPQVAVSASLDSLLDRFTKAQTPEEKKLLEDLISTLKQRL